jgi:NADH-quinone oxidoreductase subunit N
MFITTLSINTILLYHFSLFCITFLYSLFLDTYESTLTAKKTFFIMTRSIMVFLMVSILLQSLSLWTTVSSLELRQEAEMFFRLDSAYAGFILVITILSSYFFWLMHGTVSYTKTKTRYFLEWPNLFLLLILCLQLFIISDDLIIFILALELITFLILIFLNFTFSNQVTTISIEAAVKYFVFNGFSMSFLWLSLVGYYSIFTTVNLSNIGMISIFFPELLVLHSSSLAILHFCFFFAYCIKLGIGPVHFWVPDVYEGIETVNTALLVMLIGPVLFLKFILLLQPLQICINSNLLLFAGTLSILIGTLGAFSQKKIKRFLAFAGLTHFGFMFLCLTSEPLFGLFGTFFYLAFYVLMNMVFFSVLILGHRYSGTILIYFSQLKPLFYGRNSILYLLLVTLFSFAGLPPFAGFFSKALVLYTLVSTQEFGLLIFILCTVFINIYLYLRIIKIAIFESNLYASNFSIHGTTTKDYNLVIEARLANQIKYPFTRTTKALINILVVFIFCFAGILGYLPILTDLLTDFVLAVLNTR